MILRLPIWLALLVLKARVFLEDSAMPQEGRFFDRLSVTLVDDTANDGQGSWQLNTDLVYEAADGRAFAVPAGYVTDFVSLRRIPIAYRIAGNRAHRAAVLHDWLISEQIVPRREADDLFLEAMLATGVPGDIARLMHLAVRSYGDSLEPPGPEGQGHLFV